MPVRASPGLFAWDREDECDLSGQYLQAHVLLQRAEQEDEEGHLHECRPEQCSNPMQSPRGAMRGMITTWTNRLEVHASLDFGNQRAGRSYTATAAAWLRTTD